MKLVRVVGGYRLMHDGHVVSELPATAGPTHSVFDVLAACAHVLRPEADLVLLGFAAGGIVAPLRALGMKGAIEAVDLDVAGEVPFRKVSKKWAGKVAVHEGDAAAWLAKSGRHEVVIEDLSMQVPGDVTKPPVSLDVLPVLYASHLSRTGVVIANVLPVKGISMSGVIERMRGGLPAACVLKSSEFDNRFLVAARALPPDRDLERDVVAALERIGSKVSGTIGRVRLPKPPQIAYMRDR